MFYDILYGTKGEKQQIGFGYTLKKVVFVKKRKNNKESQQM